MLERLLTLSSAGTEADRSHIVAIQAWSDHELKTFKVPYLFLDLHAPNFAKIFVHPSIQTVQLKDVSTRTLDVFLGWLGTRCARTIRPTIKDGVWHTLCGDGLEWLDSGDDPIIHRDITSKTLWQTTEAAIEMYIFATTYNIPQLRQDAMDRLIWCNDTAYGWNKCGTFVSGAAIQRAYEHTEAGSPLREWLIGAFEHIPGYGAADLVDMPQRYLVDVASNYKVENLSGDGQRATEGGWLGVDCRWHEHESEEEEEGRCEIRVKVDREIEYNGIG